MIEKLCKIHIALPCSAPEYVQGRHCISGASIMTMPMILSCARIGLGSG
ncbi:MAG: hypothetical protein QGD90_08490 [Candidatus Hydrogenedentes bacterium]|nr:hypothetical protein [Candidatus Hydrogenedentota bacterium]